jgi:hypothetical protein
MARILIPCCGELAWGRPSSSVLFGKEWNRGHLSDRLSFGPDGPLAGELPGLDSVSLAEELERRAVWHSSAALGPAPVIAVSHGGPVNPPALPAWQELAEIQAQGATKELRGAGVLVTPRDWLELAQGRQLLEAWAATGWLWTPLEETLQKRFSTGCRFLSASGSFLRVMQQEGGLVFANGPEAARAIEIAESVLDRALEQLEPNLASRWRQEEEPETGWYFQQQVVRKLTKALKEGLTTVELGGSPIFRVSAEGRMIVDPRGTSGILFRFSSVAAQERYRALSTLRFKVELPAAAVSWWKQVFQPGFLRNTQGASHSGIRWEDRRAVLLEGPAIRPLSNELTARNLPYEEIDPARLEEALMLGSPLPAVPDRAAPRTSSPAPASGSPTAVASVPGASAEPALPMPTGAGLTVPKITIPAADPGSIFPQAEPPATLEPGIHEVFPSPPAQAIRPSDESQGITGLAAFLPHQFDLEVPHRSDRVQVSIDGQLVEPGNVRCSARQGLYTIEGVAVPHGAIVRVDFDPSHE